MKKIIYILMSLMVLGTSSFAQNRRAEKKGDKAKVETQSTAAPKSDDSKKEAKGPKTKKDGTADMRYKDNKEAAKPAQKLKKDGTPDMRYKENKKATDKK